MRAVTIRQLTPLLRKDRDWGSARIAVEGTSNFANAHTKIRNFVANF